MKNTSRREFGYIRRLKTGKYQASYKVEKKTIYGPHSFQTRTEAKQWLAQQNNPLSRIELEQIEDKKTQDWTFYDYAVRYLELKTSGSGKHLSSSYAAKCMQHLNGSLNEFAALLLTDITKFRVEEWWAESMRLGKITSRSNAYRFLKAVLNKAIEDEVLVSKNPCRIKGAGSASSGVPIYTPSRKDLQKLVSVSPVAFGAYAALSFTALLRFEEASCLTLGDLTKPSDDPHCRFRVSVTKSVSRVNGVFILGPTKSEAGRRETFIPMVFNDVIEAHIASLKSSEPSDLLFPSPKAGTYMHNSVIQKQLHRFRKKSGLNQPGFTLHGLRRGGATAYSEVGSTLGEVKELLGDSSSAAALRYVRTTSRKHSLSNLLFEDSVSASEYFPSAV
jgi:hypothetical protein